MTDVPCVIRVHPHWQKESICYSVSSVPFTLGVQFGHHYERGIILLVNKIMIFTQEAPLTEMVFREVLHPDRIGIWKCWFLRRGENHSTREKTYRSRVENQQQTQPTYDVESRN